MSSEKKKVLIIDDDSRNIFALSAVLRAHGFKNLSAASALEGFKILEGSNGDIGAVLMDMMMPEMDGYEAITRLKKNTRTKTMPVIAVTAQAMAGDKEKCLQAGADAYISKPINVDELLKLLNKFSV